MSEVASSAAAALGASPAAGAGSHHPDDDDDNYNRERPKRDNKHKQRQPSLGHQAGQYAGALEVVQRTLGRVLTKKEKDMFHIAISKKGTIFGRWLKWQGRCLVHD